MIHDCPKDGYFRGETCPQCGGEGKFLMNEDEMDQVGRIMAGVLRHFPERLEVAMDRNGYVEVDDLVDSIRERRRGLHWLRPHHIRAIVQTDPKGRYELDQSAVRAA